MSGRVRVYLGCSLDGYIAGAEDDLTFLDAPHAAASPLRGGPGLDYDTFMAEVGALLMGRRTHDVVVGFGVPWPYGDRPVLVATRRPLAPPGAPTVRAASGPIEDLVAQAIAAAAGGDVYLDGADLVRQALDADLVDEMTLTLVPVVLGVGVRLFDGITARRDFVYERIEVMGEGLAQITARRHRS